MFLPYKSEKVSQTEPINLLQIHYTADTSNCQEVFSWRLTKANNSHTQHQVEYQPRLLVLYIVKTV